MDGSPPSVAGAGANNAAKDGGDGTARRSVVPHRSCPELVVVVIAAVPAPAAFPMGRDSGGATGDPANAVVRLSAVPGVTGTESRGTHLRPPGWDWDWRPGGQGTPPNEGAAGSGREAFGHNPPHPLTRPPPCVGLFAARLCFFLPKVRGLRRQRGC